MKTKLKNIIANANKIIETSIASSEYKSAYFSIKEEWQTLKDVLPNWKVITFSTNDIYTETYFLYEKFSENCKTNMQLISNLCNEYLAQLENNKSETMHVQNIAKDSVFTTGTWIAIIGIIIMICIALVQCSGDTNYKLGKTEALFTNNTELIDLH